MSNSDIGGNSTMVGSDSYCSKVRLLFAATTASDILAIVIVHASYAVMKVCVVALCITVCCKRTD